MHSLANISAIYCINYLYGGAAETQKHQQKIIDFRAY